VKGGNGNANRNFSRSPDKHRYGYTPTGQQRGQNNAVHEAERKGVPGANVKDKQTPVGPKGSGATPYSRHRTPSPRSAAGGGRGGGGRGRGGQRSQSTSPRKGGGGGPPSDKERCNYCDANDHFWQNCPTRLEDNRKTAAAQASLMRCLEIDLKEQERRAEEREDRVTTTAEDPPAQSDGESNPEGASSEADSREYDSSGYGTD